MSVGLYDVDFFKYHQVMFNLEIMKMATYFKGKGEITQLSPTYSPDRYTKFYLRKDFYDGTYPVGLNRFDNLNYGGLAFTNNVYIPLSEEIEVCQPDVYVYDKYKHLFLEGAKGHKEAYTSLTNNIHLRLSLDGATVWDKLEEQIPNKKSNILFLHDVDVGQIEHSDEAVKYLAEKYSKEKGKLATLAAKFPLTIKNINEYKFWNQFTFNSNFFSMNIQGPLEDEEFIEMIDTASKAKANKIIYTVADASSSKNDFILNTLPKIFKQAIFCCRQHKKILLNIKDDFLVEEEWREVITLINLYMSAAQSYTAVPALYVFCKNLRSQEGQYKNGIMSREDARRIFLFVMEKQPELFKLFYECNEVKIINGGFENVSNRT